MECAPFFLGGEFEDYLLELGYYFITASSVTWYAFIYAVMPRYYLHMADIGTAVLVCDEFGEHSV